MRNAWPKPELRNLREIQVRATYCCYWLKTADGWFFGGREKVCLWRFACGAVLWQW